MSGLCGEPAFRSKFNGVTDQAIVDLFSLNRGEKESLREFRRLVSQVDNLSPGVIQGEFIRILEGAASRLNRKSSYGLFVQLFGDGDWSSCFPDLPSKRSLVERDVLSWLRGSDEGYLNPRLVDANHDYNVWLSDVGSELSCFVFRKDSCFICGEAEVVPEEGLNLYIFSSINYQGCPGGSSEPDMLLGGDYDGLQNAAVFGPRKKIIAAHEVAHGKDDKFLEIVLSKLPGLLRAKEMFDVGKEILADLDALKKTNISGRDYKRFRAPGERHEDPFAQFASCMSEKDGERPRVREFFERYNRELSTMIDASLTEQDYETAMMRASERINRLKPGDEDYFFSLKEAIQNEHIYAELSRIYWAFSENRRDVKSFEKRKWKKYEELKKSLCRPS
jgi:hypothetical protein